MWLTAAAAGRPIPAEKLQIKREGVCSVQRVCVCATTLVIFFVGLSFIITIIKIVIVIVW